jgi:hypothetical protein
VVILTFPLYLFAICGKYGGILTHFPTEVNKEDGKSAHVISKSNGSSTIPLFELCV